MLYCVRIKLLRYSSSTLEVFLGKGALKNSANLQQNSYQSAISIDLQGNFGMGVLLYLLHIFRAPRLENTSRWLLYKVVLVLSILTKILVSKLIRLRFWNSYTHSAYQNTEFFLVHIFPYSDWIWRLSE